MGQSVLQATPWFELQLGFPSALTGRGKKRVSQQIGSSGPEARAKACHHEADSLQTKDRPYKASCQIPFPHHSICRMTLGFQEPVCHPGKGVKAAGPLRKDGGGHLPPIFQTSCDGCTGAQIFLGQFIGSTAWVAIVINKAVSLCPRYTYWKNKLFPPPKDDSPFSW